MTGATGTPAGPAAGMPNGAFPLRYRRPVERVMSGVVITGAAGNVGAGEAPVLSERRDLRVTDRTPGPGGGREVPGRHARRTALALSRVGNGTRASRRLKAGLNEGAVKLGFGRADDAGAGD